MKIGDKIHLKNRNGTYTVIGIDTTGFVVTCGRWQDYENGKTLRSFHDNYKCHYGGDYKPFKISPTVYTYCPENKAALKTKFRELMKIHHPDHGGDAANFRKVYAAYKKAKEIGLC